MSRRPFPHAAMAIAGAAAAVGVACTSSTGPKLTGKQLAGSYTLVGVSTHPCAGCINGYGSDFVHGNLHFTDTSYSIYAVVDTSNAPSDTLVVASGTGLYSVHGSILVAMSLVDQNTDTATVTLSHSDTLMMTITAPQGAPDFIWVRSDLSTDARRSIALSGRLPQRGIEQDRSW